MRRFVYDAERIAPWVLKRSGVATYVPGSCTAIGLECDGELIAGTLYEDYNGANLMMHVAAEPGRIWATHEYLGRCFHYPFVQLGCKRVTGMAAQNNLASWRFQLHIGFREEARLKDAHPHGDLIVLVMTRAECRWIGECNAERYKHAARA